MHDIKIYATSKRSWNVAFYENLSFRIFSVPHASPRKFRPKSPCKPVARRISFDDDPPSPGALGLSVPLPSCLLEQAMDFQSQEARPLRKQRRKKPILESEVRRSARISAINNGFKPESVKSPVIQDLKKRKKTPKSAPVRDDMHPKSPCHPTPIKTLQSIGAKLGIDPSKLSRDQLMADLLAGSTSIVSP